MALCGIFFIDLIGRLNSVGFGIKSAFIYVLAFDTLLGQDYTDIEQGYVFTAMTRFNVWGCWLYRPLCE